MVNAGVIESSLAAARWMIKYDGDVADCAAAYLYHFVANQGFVDGNKRTGLAAAIEFLARNGYRVDANKDETYEMVMNIAKGRMKQESVGEWIGRRLEPMP